jgi:hypothetical protein
MAMTVKWVANLSHVREVMLLGTADLAYWKDRLREEKLEPVERDGQARIMVIAADLKYWGVRFREVSFSVLVRPYEDLTRQNAAYLLGAYNSLWMFAFVERVIFSTPYNYGDVRVSASSPALVHVVQNNEVVFRAEMAADGGGPGREPSQVGEDGWIGPVFLPEKHRFLPEKHRGQGRSGKLFFSQVRGETRTYPLMPAQDVVAIKRSTGCEVLQALSDSHFAAKRWNIREDAAHAKSKTYKRTDLARLAEVPDLAAARTR